MDILGGTYEDWMTTNSILRRSFWFFLFVLCIALPPAILHAAVYYVSNSGNDLAAGIQSAPWRSIQKAAANVEPGDTVIIRSGTYPESLSTAVAGSKGKVITFKADGEVIIRSIQLKHDYNIVQGFKMISQNTGHHWDYISVTGSFCRVMDNVITQNTTDLLYGIRTYPNSSHCLVSGNTLEGLAGPCIALGGYDNVVEKNVIRRALHDAMRIGGHDNIVRSNIIRDLDPENRRLTHVDLFQGFGPSDGYNILIDGNIGINCNAQIGNFEQKGGNFRDWTFINNVFINVANAAHIVAPGFKFYNNTFYKSGKNTGSPILFRAKEGVDGVVINNIFVDCGRLPDKYGWYGADTSIPRPKADYNFVAGAPEAGFPPKAGGFEEPHGINGGNPQFVNIAAHDLRLQGASPAVDSGTATGFSHDFAGISRPLGAGWDRGAFETELSKAVRQGLSAPANLKIID